jgi:hypothetical protein
MVPVGAGFLAVGSACPSDHVALWIDLRKEDVLGTNSTPLPSPINRMKASDPQLVKKYNEQARKALRKHAVTQQLQLLSSTSRTQWTAENTAQFNRLQLLNTEIRKNIGASIRKVCLGNLPWSPRLQRYFDKIELMKLIVRKRQGVQTSMSKIRRLMRITGAWNVLKIDLDASERLLNDAFSEYKAARGSAPDWRDTHVDALDQALAEKNSTTPATEKKKRREIERQRKLSRKIKFLRNKTKNSVTKLFLQKKTAPVSNALPRNRWKRPVSQRMNVALANRKAPPHAGLYP